MVRLYQSTSLHGKQGVQGAYVLVQGGSVVGLAIPYTS